jgi:hypothetical protein
MNSCTCWTVGENFVQRINQPFRIILLAHPFSACAEPNSWCHDFLKSGLAWRAGMSSLILTDIFFQDEVLDPGDEWPTVSSFCTTVGARWKQSGSVSESCICYQAYLAPEWLLNLMKTVMAPCHRTQGRNVRVPWVGARDRCLYIAHVLRDFIVKFRNTVSMLTNRCA